MRKRKKLSKKGSRKLFTATASKSHRKNFTQYGPTGPMRGGIRL